MTHGLELSQEVKALTRAACGAPEGERSDRKLRCRASQARPHDEAPFGAPLPLLRGAKILWNGVVIVAKLGRIRAARTLCLVDIVSLKFAVD